jgi:hypothetical protein
MRSVISGMERLSSLVRFGPSCRRHRIVPFHRPSMTRIIASTEHSPTSFGQPTGGNQRGINGGAFFFLRLPKSQIEMDLPPIGTFPTSPQPDAGLTPDVLVAPTVQDIVNGVDAATLHSGAQRLHRPSYMTTTVP